MQKAIRKFGENMTILMTILKNFIKSLKNMKYEFSVVLDDQNSDDSPEEK